MSEYKISVKPETFPNGMIKLTFTSNGGKFGTDEILDIIKLTPEQLLNTLQANEDNTSEEPALNIDLVSNCSHEWKTNSCDTMGFALTEYCENCDTQRDFC